MTQLSRRICVLVLGASLLVGYSPISLAAKQKSKPPEVSVIQGFSQDRLRRIVPVMQDQINKNMFPGAVTLVARNGQIVHFEATGYLDAQKKTPIQKDSIFRLASMTKPVVTAAAMMLV
jgi:CubicO group peptidase (beta-lactamase class C family)